MTDFKLSFVKPSSTIKECIQVIEDSEAKIALVVDEHEKLLGTITDGDIRRGILRGMDFNSAAREVMSDQPLYCNQGDSEHLIISKMRQELVVQLPILDAEGRVVRLEFLSKLIGAPKRDNWVVLMAGGRGTRLYPLTKDTPKPLLDVGGKPLLETIINNFIDYGFYNFLISVHYLSEKIVDYFEDGSRFGANIEYIFEDKALGTAGPLSMLKKKPDKPLFVMNGDILTNVNMLDILNYHNEHESDITLCVRQYSFQVPYGVVRFDENYELTEIQEKPLHHYFASAGIYVLNPDMIDYVPHNEEFTIPELVQSVQSAGRKTAVCPIREYWLDIGQHNDFDRANNEYASIFK